MLNFFLSHGFYIFLRYLDLLELHLLLSDVARIHRQVDS